MGDIVLLVISACLCGIQEWEAIENFGNHQFDWLTGYGSFSKGIPSHDTIERVFSSLDPQELGSCMACWTELVREKHGDDLIAIDGKRICGSVDITNEKPAMHIVSAYSFGNKLCIGQVATEAKSNEITAIPELLKLLDIKDSTITIDAIGCQTKIAEQIVEKDAHYILAVKGNQPKLQENIADTLRFLKPDDVYLEQDFGHGRIENRKCSVYKNLEFVENKNDWRNLSSIVVIDSTRTIKSTGKSNSETRLYISDANKPAKEFNSNIRNHWAIENNLHWNLDVIFNEDKSKKRRSNAAQNFNIVRKIVLAILEHDVSRKESKGQKRLSALQDIKYREKLLRF